MDQLSSFPGGAGQDTPTVQMCHSRHPGLGDTANRDLSPSPPPTAPDPLFPGGLWVKRRLTERPGGRHSTHPASPVTPVLLLRFISTGSETRGLGQSTTQGSTEPVSSLRVGFAAQTAAPHQKTRGVPYVSGQTGTRFI